VLVNTSAIRFSMILSVRLFSFSHAIHRKFCSESRELSESVVIAAQCYALFVADRPDA
jgi:hypothetical protein